jgi:hypothetical protein
MRAPIIALLLLAGCPGDDLDTGAAPWEFPAVDALPEQVEPPDPFTTFFGGRRIESTDDWERLRRPELLALFDHYLYGVAAEAPSVSVEETGHAPLDGGGALRELELHVGEQRTLRVALFLPEGVAAPPVVLGLNKCGNHTLLADEAITEHDAWQDPDCDPTRGSRASAWSLERAWRAGFAVASLHASDIDPDDREDDEQLDGVQAEFEGGEPSWATLSAWAWGLSRAIDGLEQHGAVDSSRVVLMGHSRRGKAALLAGARDERVAMVWAHQSGTGGQALSRHTEGETIAAITTFFPHWFVPAFAEFAGQETLLPIDQHLLLALLAPRPLICLDGDEDAWADPEGAALAVELAQPVWEIYGAGGLEHQLRPGGHEVNDGDWERVLAFAGAWLQPSRKRSMKAATAPLPWITP